MLPLTIADETILRLVNTFEWIVIY
ncbi:hypothetical protein [Bacillus vallismortis]